MLKLLKNATKKQWLLALVCLFLVITQVWLELKMPDYMSEITQLDQKKWKQMEDILINWWLYACLCIWKFGCSNNYRVYNIKNIFCIFNEYKKKNI